jgi:para-nitrobenzyl esterase
MKFITVFLFSIAVINSACTQDKQTATSDTVMTAAGEVSGALSADSTVRIYKGVPYAAPPVGELRWKAPQPVKPWSGVLKADKFPPSPIQGKPAPFMMWTEEFITPEEPLSEDCLYLNIWTAAKTPQHKLPVLVWIHGGGFVSGSGACAVYDGEALAKEGIVYVSINYRLGVFGYLAHPDLTKESPYHASGNYAVLDQIEALKWIKENIASFGGDPDKVTIAGQSAGSFSVQTLVASPLAKGLFRGAIAQSGASFNRMSMKLAAAEKAGLALTEKAGVSSINDLRKMSADKVFSLTNEIPRGSFLPIIDGYVIPDDMRNIFVNKKHNDVALMAGWVTGDAALAVGTVQPAEKFKEFAANTYGDKKDDFLKIFPASDDLEAKRSQEKLAIMNFAAFTNHLWAALNSSKSYLYQFSYVPTDKPGFPNYGAFHTSDVPFALRTLTLWDRPWREVDYAVEKTMSSYWINFVKTGNPNGVSLPEWKNYDKQHGYILEFTEIPELNTDMYKKEFQFLESVNH